MKRWRIDPAFPETDRIAQAAETLRAGGVVAFPTETFYGLAADSANETAIQRIFALKGRDAGVPIALIGASSNDACQVAADISPVAQRLMDVFWPGPLTLVFAAAADVSLLLTAGTGKIGLRLSSHPIAAALAAALGRPITATSANRSGQPVCVTLASVLEQLDEELLDGGIDGGDTAGGQGSTVVDAAGNDVTVLREGAIAAERIRGIFFGAAGSRP